MTHTLSTTSRSRLLATAIAAVYAVFPALLHAQDTLHLPNGDHLTGHLSTISETGEATFLPIDRTTAVTLLPNTLKSVDFQTKSTRPVPLSSELIQLTNGDTLSCKITSMNNQVVTINSWFAGELSLARDFISQITFNNDSSRKIPLKDLTWKKGPHSKWTITSKTLSSKGNGTLSCTPKLTKNFIIQCALAWERQHPRFKIYFCSNSDQLRNISESYYLECTGNSLDIYRTFASGLNKKLGTHPINLRRHSKSTIDLEIQIDRVNNQIALIVDGAKKSIFDDTDISPPAGKHLLIHSSINNFQSLTLKDFQLYQWNDDLLEIDPHSSDSSDESDILIDDDKDRLAGLFSMIEMKDGKRHLIFDISKSQQSVSIPFKRIRQLQLKSSHSPSSLTPALYNATLGDSTSLSLNSIQLENEVATAIHPILGEFSIPRNAFSKLTTQHD